MIIRPIPQDERERYDEVVKHPLQSWAWGEFRRVQGQKVERLGVFDDNGNLIEGLQVTFHDLPVIGGTVGYLPKGPQPNAYHFPALRDLGKKHGAVFIKLEPNVMYPAGEQNYFNDTMKLLEENNARPGQALFTPYTFTLDLTPDPETIFENCKSKTRYNIRLARKKGVEIVEDTSEQGLEDYLRLLQETTDRQGFYAHDEQYFRTMWEHLGKQQTQMFRILKAMYEGKVISAWIIFLHNGVGYYPYGASSREHRDVMANNLLMWETLMLAKREGCTSFDMWGSLGPNPDPSHKWFGFHRFKEGYGATLMQSLGTHDLVLDFPKYTFFTLANKLRWAYLRTKARLSK